MRSKTKYHGMWVISDDDLASAKGNDVIEVNSNDELVCRHYDLEGNADDNPLVLNLTDLISPIQLKKLTEANITGAIKRTMGKHSMLISKSAIEMIENFIS